MNKLKFFGRTAIKSAEGKLFKCKTVFPFDLVPDTIKLDEEKLVVTHREWFIKQVITMQVKDLLNVEVIAGPFFASAKVFSRYVTGGNYPINWMWKRDAFKLRTRVNELLSEANADPHTGGQ